MVIKLENVGIAVRDLEATKHELATRDIGDVHLVDEVARVVDAYRSRSRGDGHVDGGVDRTDDDLRRGGGVRAAEYQGERLGHAALGPRAAELFAGGIQRAVVGTTDARDAELHALPGDGHGVER